MSRTPEEGHTKKCLAAAIIAAVENARDAEQSDVSFVLDMQDNPLHTAYEYLETGLMTCVCPPLDVWGDVECRDCGGSGKTGLGSLASLDYCDTCDGIGQVWAIVKYADETNRWPFVDMPV